MLELSSHFHLFNYIFVYRKNRVICDSLLSEKNEMKEDSLKLDPKKRNQKQSRPLEIQQISDIRIQNSMC